MDKQQALWAIVPALDLVNLTLDTCRDLLAQSVPVRVLLVDQGSSAENNAVFRVFAEDAGPERVLLWSFNPPLPSLSACWNRALGFVWAVGGEEALVCNSDVRLRPDTAAQLRSVRQLTGALFVSAVGVTAEQFHPEEGLILCDDPDAEHPQLAKGGPDFSCFLLTKAGHDRYPFDEGFIPAFMEDCDCHRRYLLGGDGDRIFSVNLPFHHIGGGSRTINQSDEARQRFERQAGIGRAHYQRKWGGGPNQERFIRPFSGHGFDGVTNPELQARQQAGEPLLPPMAAVAADMDRASATMQAQLNRELFGADAEQALGAAFQKKAQDLHG